MWYRGPVAPFAQMMLNSLNSSSSGSVFAAYSSPTYNFAWVSGWTQTTFGLSQYFESSIYTVGSGKPSFSNNFLPSSSKSMRSSSYSCSSKSSSSLNKNIFAELSGDLSRNFFSLKSSEKEDFLCSILDLFLAPVCSSCGYRLVSMHNLPAFSLMKGKSVFLNSPKLSIFARKFSL